MTNPTEQINKDAEKFVGTLAVENKAQEVTKEYFDEELDEKVRYIPSINFTDCGTANTQLPINVANETITILSKYRSEFDFVDFIKEKLNYNSRIAVCMAFFSEQIDALVLAIKQFESNKALILGDMAGIGKGRVCAGILRYAYQNKIIPVFITEKENLFSDMYFDIMGIGGFGGSGGNVIEPKPFIMNPYTSDRKSVIQDDKGIVHFTPLNRGEVDALLQRPKKDAPYTFPFQKKNKEFDFNCVFLTYNVVSKTRGDSGDNKRKFIRDISVNSIIIMDECHNASGKSRLGAEAKIFVDSAKGILFSSATFAKNPQAFPLYIIKTAMREAQIDITTIEKSIESGGENVSEYISSVLVKEGQMIRRERDFGGCTLGTIYEGSDLPEKDKDEAKDRIYGLFDTATKKFRDIYNYIRKADFKNAVAKSVSRLAEEEQIILAPQTAYYEARGNEDRERDFIKNNKGKWVIAKLETNTLGATTKFHYTENILLAIKSKFTADAVIKELQTEAEYEYFDGKKRKSNRKPVIALRATGENLFSKLNLKTGDKIKNDFGEYIRAVVSGVMNGKVVFRKIDNNLFIPKYAMEEDGKEHVEETLLYEIENQDLPDNGRRLNQLLEDVRDYNAQIPLCPIDYFIERIQSVQRKPNDRFGSTTVNYKVGEVTGRNYSLVKEKGTDLWIYTPNDRDKAVRTAFNKFNSGQTDVLILNSSGSTGGSIQSKYDFADQRPRIMFITQVELDVNTEVQKRGRINRSGQVNFPAYLYVLSQIPSEIRKFLSLKRKLRRLDANTSANQTQNSNLVDIKDKSGNPIYDIFNIYGEEAFKKFISDDANFECQDINREMTANWRTGAYTEEYAEGGEVVKAMLQPFSRELEIYPCDLQEDFYNKINVIYKSVVEDRKNDGTYQLELDIEDLKASLRSRVVRQMNNGFTEFSKPLFMEDKYCLARKRLWTKEKLDNEIIRMATNFYKDKEIEFTNTTTFHNQLLDDFEQNYQDYIDGRLNEFRLKKEPKRDEYLSDEEFATDLNEYETKFGELATNLESERAWMREFLMWYKPNRNIYIPESSGSGENITMTYRKGKFVGYTFKHTSIQNKYSKGSVYFKFAFMEGNIPTLEINSVSTEHRTLLSDIKRSSQERFSATTLIGGRTMGEMENEKVDKWNVNPNARQTVRFLSGNVLSGIQLANNMDDISRWSLVKYTNEDGTIATSIRLDYPSGVFTPMADAKGERFAPPIQVSLSNPNIIEYLKMTPPDYRFMVGVNTFRSKSVEPSANGGQDMIVKNLIGIKKGKTVQNNIYFEFFQGLPDRRSKNEAGELAFSDVPVVNATNGNNPIFFAPFLNDYTPITTKTYVKNSPTPYELYNDSWGETNGKKTKGGFSKIYGFENIDTPEGERALRIFFDKLFNEQELSLDFPQSINDYYNVTFQLDPFKADERKKEKEQVKAFDEGEYEYKLEVDFDAKYNASLPPFYRKYNKGKNSFDKGTIILGQPILPSYARAYNIYPIGLSNEDTVKLLLSIFTSEEKADFINKLTERAEKGEDSKKIGDFVSTVARQRSVPDLKYIFGNRRASDIGELLKSYALKGDITQLSYEVVEKQPEEMFKTTRKKNTITLEDAEKFVNYLLF
jgi:hypothetical protein